MEMHRGEKAYLDESLFADLFTPGEEESIQNFKSFSKLFRQSWVESTGKMDEAIARSDFSALKMIAHTLKGAAANMGALAMIKICAAIETHVKSEDLKEIARLSDLLKTECEKVENALEDYGRRLARPAR